MNAVDIVPYEPAFEGVLAEIWESSWRSAVPRLAANANSAELRERFAADAASKWSLLVAKLSGEPVGFAAYIEADGCLDQLFIGPPHQGHGIGVRLLDKVKERMPSGIWLRAAVENESACRFYEAHGFERCEEVPHPSLSHMTVIYRWGPVV